MDLGIHGCVFEILRIGKMSASIGWRSPYPAVSDFLDNVF
jgi:hypothetical protein